MSMKLKRSVLTTIVGSVQLNGSHSCRSHDILGKGCIIYCYVTVKKIFRFVIFTGCNEVVAKVIFLHLSVILFTGGVSASVHAGMPPPPLSRRPPRRRYPPLPRRIPHQGDPPTKETSWKEAPPLPRRTPHQGDPLPRRPPWKEAPTPKGGTPAKETPYPRKETPQKEAPPAKETPQKETPQKEAPPGRRHPPAKETPLPRNEPPWKEAPPGIRSMSGRYASYWNAFLFQVNFIQR